MNELLIDGWLLQFKRRLKNARKSIRIVSPFIKTWAVNSLLDNCQSNTEILVITRLNDQDFIDEISDIKALILLCQFGCRIRAQDRSLHSKLYLFDDKYSVITSSNFTKGGLVNNSELGYESNDQALLKKQIKYFENRWERLGPDIELDELIEIEKETTLNRLHSSGQVKRAKGVKDRGKKLVKVKKDRGRKLAITKGNDGESNEYWAKFMWRRSDPAQLDYNVEENVDSLGAVTFPSHPGRPNSIKTGQIIYHVALANTDLGKDWLAFGRGRVAIEHRKKEDTLSNHLRANIPEIARYPYLIWLRDIELIKGDLNQAISLRTLFDEFGDQTFKWSQQKAEEGKPGRYKEAISYYRSHIQLTELAAERLNHHLDEKFTEIGKVTLLSGNDVWWNDYIRKYDSDLLFTKK